jgi:hypothetical protein
MVLKAVSIKSNALYPNICGDGMFKLQWEICKYLY